MDNENDKKPKTRPCPDCRGRGMKSAQDYGVAKMETCDRCRGLGVITEND